MFLGQQGNCLRAWRNVLVTLPGRHIDNSGLDPSKDFLAVTEALDGLNKELQGLERHFKERAAQGMPKYDVERTQKSVSEVRAEYLRLQDRLQPKKKFGFKVQAFYTSKNKTK